MSQLYLVIKLHIGRILYCSSFKTFSIYSLFYLIALQIYRVIFLFHYSYRAKDASYWDISKAFLVGIRFDLATISILLGFFALLSSITILNRFKIYRFLWNAPPLLLFFWMIGVLITDIVYFENGNKHIGYEAFVFLLDLPMILLSTWDNNRFVFILSMLTGFVGFPLLAYLYWKWNPYQYSEDISRYIFIPRVLFVLFLTVVLSRGGLQIVPLRSSNSIVSNHAFVNTIALNGIYTAISDLNSHTIPPSEKMNLKDATAKVREQIQYAGAEFVDDAYPLLRKTIPSGKNGKLPNIVLVLLESWTGKFISPISDGKVNGKEIAPNFNKLLQKGIFFTNCYASGGRTTNGMMAALSGIPDRPGLTAVRTPQILGNFSGLGTILKKLGYKTLFVTGGEMKFDNNHIILPHWGYDTLIGKEVIDTYSKYSIGAWGYDDEIAYNILLQELSKINPDQPFLATILTLSTHYPYKTPDKKFDILDSSVQDYEYLNVYHYSDWALGEFMSKVEKEPYFKDTIFLFISDHAHHRFLNYYEDRNIPFLIYAPNYFLPELRKDIVSQLDVIPTILGMVDREVYFSAMGRDILKTKEQKGFGYFAYGSLFGWIEENLFYFKPSNGKGEITMTVAPPHGDNPICKTDPAPCENAHLKAKAYLNLSIELMNKNLVFPGR